MFAIPPLLARMVVAVLLVSAGAAAPATEGPTADIARVEIVGTAFRPVAADGTPLPAERLIGAVLMARHSSDTPVPIRIDAMQPDPKDPEITLYALSVRGGGGSEWEPLCRPGPDGLALGFPLAGSWSADGRHLKDGTFKVTCTGGAIGKCVRWGYKPWKDAANGESLWDYHQACTRLVRADYCGDGVGTTRDGTLIDIYDRLGIQKVEPTAGVGFEAAWGMDGAVCLRRTRVAERATVEQVLASCPGKFKKLPPDCSEADAAQLNGVMFLNRSREP